MNRIKVVDSHTGGEPTRVVLNGWPGLEGLSMRDRVAAVQTTLDEHRKATILEPRGSDVLVGALLLEPTDPTCDVATIFFNNVGTLGMCGHGTIGLVETLRYLGKAYSGQIRVETPVGIVNCTLHESGEVSVENVPSFLLNQKVNVEVPEIGVVTGDVAYGGNWFFLIENHGQVLELANHRALTEYCSKVKAALLENWITGSEGTEIDHVELFGPSDIADSKNFVLCPGNAFDRSPCGTGTSAKMACLMAAGKLGPGESWTQESITGSVFRGSAEWSEEGLVLPTITGRAWVTSEAELILHEDDPLRWGLPL